ncbi:MAG: hypothetical protein OHK0052_26610 [Anaerolineales bacterium]
MLAAGVWSLVVLFAFAIVPPRWRLPARRSVLWLFLLALGVRLLPNVILKVGGGYDIESFALVGEMLAHGREIYAATEGVNRHPYLPLYLYWLAAAWNLAQLTGLVFVQVVRLLPIAADVGVSLALFVGLRGRDAHLAWQAGLLYALNPVAVFVAAYHGQFDALPGLFLLLAVLWMERERAAGSGFWLGLGILAKSYPVLALPMLFWQARGARAKAMLLTGAVLVPLGGVALYAFGFSAAPLLILRRALTYNWGVGIWGYTYLLRMAAQIFEQPDLYRWVFAWGRVLTLAVLAGVFLWRARHEPPARGILLILLTFFAAGHAFSIQYLGWLLPLALWNGEFRWARRYTLAAFAYMFLVYFSLILQSTITNLLPWPQADWYLLMPLGLPIWLVCVFWGIKCLRQN